MAVFQVELKKVVDDSYSIEIGHGLTGKLIRDLAGGLAGQIRRFAVITDSTVEPLVCQAADTAALGGGIPGGFVFVPGRGKKQDPGNKGDA